MIGGELKKGNLRTFRYRFSVAVRRSDFGSSEKAYLVCISGLWQSRGILGAKAASPNANKAQRCRCSEGEGDVEVEKLRTEID